MVDRSDAIAVAPQVMLLEQVLNELSSGRLRVPRFQRPFVWRPEQMLTLFDSIERGYPIGSLLVWDTELELPTLDRIADIQIPRARGGGHSYVLDGHQRLSTLLGTLLRRPEGHRADGQREWMWNVYRVLGQPEGQDHFRHWKTSSTEPPPNFLPMRAVLKTMDFLSYSRRLTGSHDLPSRTAALVEEAEVLAHRMKSYQVAVVRLQGGDLRHAVEVFSRLNSSGQAMTPDQMVSALTYQADTESLADAIASIREDLSTLGFGQVTHITVFRSILAVAGEDDIQDVRWEKLAGRVEPKLQAASSDASIAIRSAVGFLRDIGVPLVRLVPYQLQIVLLVAFFHYSSIPTQLQLDRLVKWFWGTSWSGFFAGANTTQVKQALLRMKAFASGRKRTPWDPQPARPFPDKFDLRGARVRAFILWELRSYPERISFDGATFDPVEALALSDVEAYRHVVRGVQSASSPANRLILPTPPGVSVRSALLEVPADLRREFLASHGIPRLALTNLRHGNDEAFVKLRMEALAAREAEFISELRVPPATEPSGDTDIDTE